MIQQVNLVDICKPKQWKTIASSQLLDKGYPVYGANGKIGFHSEYTHEHPTILITCRGATCGTINICDPKSYVNGNAMALDELDSSLDLMYLFYVLNSRGFDDVISGSAQPQITRQNLKNFKIPLPPLSEQQKIAAILDAADSLRQKDQQLIERYTALSQSLFLEMFGDPVTNPMDWKSSSLGGVSTKITDGEHQNPLVTETGKNLIMAKDVLNDRVDFSKPRYVSHENYTKYIKKCKPEVGDVLLVSRGATVGRCTIVDTKIPFCLMGSVILIKPNKNLDGLYLQQLLKNHNFSKKLVNVSSASAQQAIYIAHLKKLNIPVPTITLQKQFAESIKLIEAQKQQIQASLQKSEALFNSLLQQAFTGELTRAPMERAA